MQTHNLGNPKILLFGLLLFSFLGLGAQCNQDIENFTFIGELNNSAYYLSNNPAQPMEAEAIALNVGGHLVSINSEEENALIQENINEMTYIGLNDRQSEGNLRWTDESQLGYTNYVFCSFCQVNDGENDYAVLHPWDGGWSFTNRWSSRNYVIEITCTDNGDTNDNGDIVDNDDTNDADESEGTATGCETNLEGFSFLGALGNRTYFLSDNSYNFMDAFNVANQNGGNLVVVNNVQENDFLQDKIEEMVFIGLNDSDEEGLLSWAGSNIFTSFRNFENDCSFCNDNDAENDFALIHPWNGKWSFTNQYSQRRFIMEQTCEDGDDSNSSISYTDCPSDITIQLSAGQTSTIANWPIPTPVNQCNLGFGGNSQVSGPLRGSTLTAGIYPIGYQASNVCGDLVECFFRVEVISSAPQSESTAYFINCPEDTTYLLEPGQNTAFVSWTSPSARSTCILGGISVNFADGPNNYSNLSEGIYEVEYSVTNNCRDTSFCTFNITVTSQQSSSLSYANCPEPLLLTHGSITSWTPPSLISNCANGVNTNSQISGPSNNTTLAVGEYVVRYRATNNCGDVAICEFPITVQADPNNIGIELECVQDQTFTLLPGRANMTVEYIEPTIVINDCAAGGESLERILGIPNNAVLNAGTYTIRYRASDNCNAFTECEFQVHVIATYHPIEIECVQDQTFTLPVGQNNMIINYIEPSISVNNCSDGDGDLQRTEGVSNNSSLSAGSYNIKYRASDNCNTSDECEFTINVNSSEPSSLEYTNCPDTMYVIFGDTVSWTPPSILNNCTAGVRSNMQISGPTNNIPLRVGEFKIIFEATNNCGDVTNCQFVIHVREEEEEEEPTISFTDCPDDYIQIIPDGSDEVALDYSIPVFTNTCPDQAFEIGRTFGPEAGTMVSVGSYYIEYIVQNVCGEYDDCSFTIDVISGQENSSISIVCQEDQVLRANNPPLPPVAQAFFTQPVVTNTCDANNGDFVLFQTDGLLGATVGVGGDGVTFGFAAYNYCGDTVTCQWNITVLPPDLPTSLEIDCPSDTTIIIPQGQSSTLLTYDEPNTNNICGLGPQVFTERIEGPPSNTIVPAGSYPIRYTFRNFCGDTTECSFVITVNDSTSPLASGQVSSRANSQSSTYVEGGEENYYLSVSKIYPNPAVDEINLALQTRESDNYDIQIYNAMGRLVEQRSTFIPKGESKERIDISRYSHGMYFVVIQDSQMRATKVKFIKVENLD